MTHLVTITSACRSSLPLGVTRMRGWDTSWAIYCLSIRHRSKSGVSFLTQGNVDTTINTLWQTGHISMRLKVKTVLNKDFLVLLNYRQLNPQQNYNSVWVSALRVT